MGRVDADDNESVARIALFPLLDVRECADAVDATVLEEIEQYDLATQVGDPQGRGVQPRQATVEFGRPFPARKTCGGTALAAEYTRCKQKNA